MKLKIRNKKNRPNFSTSSGALIALTGNIGSGKSYILDCLQKFGFITFDSDLEAKKIIRQSSEIKSFLINNFPDTVTNNEIDFNTLSKVAFKTPSIIEKLTSVSHTELHIKQEKFITDHRGKTIIFEIPLLFENDREKYFDYVILANADTNTTKERALRRKGMTEEKFHDILARQISVDPDDPRVDFCIDTSKSKEHTNAQLMKILNDQ